MTAGGSTPVHALPWPDGGAAADGSTDIKALADAVEREFLELGTPSGFTGTIGDGAALSYVVTHGLGTQNVHVTVYQSATPFEEVDCVVQHTSATTVTINVLTAPAAGAYTVYVTT